MDSGTTLASLKDQITSWSIAKEGDLPLFAVAYKGIEPVIVVIKNTVLFNQLCSSGLKVLGSLKEQLGLKTSSITIQRRVNVDKTFIKALFDAFVHHRRDHTEFNKYREITFVKATPLEALS